MNASIFAEWLIRQGHHIARSESGCWYDAAPRVYQSFPYHCIRLPREGELPQLLRDHRALCARYSTHPGANGGCVSYHAVCDNKAYALEALDRRTRQNVRRGLKECGVEPIPLTRVADEGWELEADTCRRQTRQSAFTKKSFRIRVNAAEGLPGFEAWGAVVGGRLAAYLLALRVDDTLELLSQACRTECLRNSPNHALVFVATREFIRRPDVRSVFYTVQSLDAPSNVDEFKFRMGYTAKPIRQRVAFHPLIAPLVNKLSYAGLRQLRKFWSYKPYLTKAEGMFRFYLSGKASASEQDWPECLSANKAELLNTLCGCSAEEPKRISSN